VALRVLDETNWNRKEAARKLNICYKALLNKLKKWNVEDPPARRPQGKTRSVMAAPGGLRESTS
jgi:hypothetical protein